MERRDLGLHPKTFPLLAVLGPKETLRCPECTLPPPCRHMDLATITAIANERVRAIHALPERPSEPLCQG